MMAKSGQIRVTSSGTAVQGDDEQGSLFALTALPANLGVVWVGNDDTDADVSLTTGFPLLAYGPPLVLALGNLNQIWVDADSSGDKLCWIKLN